MKFVPLFRFWFSLSIGKNIWIIFSFEFSLIFLEYWDAAKKYVFDQMFIYLSWNYLWMKNFTMRWDWGTMDHKDEVGWNPLFWISVKIENVHQISHHIRNLKIGTSFDVRCHSEKMIFSICILFDILVFTFSSGII